MRRLLTLPFRVVAWLGRVVLWLLLPPLGLWRSIRHGRRARDRRLARDIAKGQGR